MRGILVVARRRIDGYPGGLFTLKSFTGLLSTGVSLQRQRFVGGKYLEQEGKSVAVPICCRGTERLLRIVVDHVEQRAIRPAVGAEDRCRPLRVRAEPEFCLRMRRGNRLLTQRRDSRSRPPGVGADHPVEQFHQSPIPVRRRYTAAMSTRKARST
ncbi:Uncharacterised protein [Mycobacteroides abscessus subsp. abscessus]|nr:Uncharacterised protein [Mycobacteroides abscessus subsp. abscessus]